MARQAKSRARVLVWGVRSDAPTALALGALDRRGADVIHVDQAAYSEIDLDLPPDRPADGWLSIAGRVVNLASITAAYVRPQDSRTVNRAHPLTPDDPAWPRIARIDAQLLAWLETTSALVINRPSNMAANGSKPYQAEMIRAAGFMTPRTLITTDADAVKAFWREHRQVVYKSISGTRSIVRRLDEAVHLARLDDVTTCPTQFQEYVPGHDWRVHVIGTSVFACEVICDADDYRYAHESGDPIAIESRELDAQLRRRCVELARRCGLVFAGIDLRMAPSGDWCCFEVNPAPGYSYYQHATGARIDDAVARVLMRGALS